MATRTVSKDTSSDDSRARSALAKHTDALFALLISLLIFGGAWVVRVLPQISNLESQMDSIRGQLEAVNESLARVEQNELLRLQLTAHELQEQLATLARDAQTVQAELEGGASQTAAMRLRLAALQGVLDELDAQLSPDAGPLPDLRGEAEALATSLAETRARLVPDDAPYPKLHEEALAVSRALEEAKARISPPMPDVKSRAASLEEELERSQQKLAAANERLDAVHREAKALAEKVTAARQAAQIVPCSEVPGTKTMALLRRKGFCAK